MQLAVVHFVKVDKSSGTAIQSRNLTSVIIREGFRKLLAQYFV